MSCLMRRNLPRVYEGFGVDVPDWLSAREGRGHRAEPLHHLLPLAVLQRFHRHPAAVQVHFTIV